MQVLTKNADGSMEFVDLPASGSSAPTVLDFMTAPQLADVLAGSMSVDVSSAFMAAQATMRHVVVPGHKYLINTSITGLSDRTWDFRGAFLKTTQDSIVMLNYAGKQDFHLMGTVKLGGSYSDGQARSGGSPTAQDGIRIDGCWKFTVGTVVVENFKGCGYKTRASATGWPGGIYGGRGYHQSVIARNCNVGIQTDDGPVNEYQGWGWIEASDCSIGFRQGAGNAGISGGIIASCTYGLVLQAGPNHLHGVTSNLQVNHNGVNVYAEDITLGHDFANCHFYDGPMDFRGCRNIVFNGGVLDVATINCVDGPTQLAGNTYFSHMRLPRSAGSTAPVPIGAKAANVKFRDCWDADWIEPVSGGGGGAASGRGASALLKCNASGAVLYGENIASVTKDATGLMSFVFSVPFTTAEYVIAPAIHDGATGGQVRAPSICVQTRYGFTLKCVNAGNSLMDPVYWEFACFGVLDEA